MTDLIKCLAAAHLPLSRRGSKANKTWFERVDALPKGIQSEVDKARKEERERIVNSMQRAWETRCDSYEPWPDDADDAPSNATARHVFELLCEAASGDTEELARKGGAK